MLDLESFSATSAQNYWTSNSTKNIYIYVPHSTTTQRQLIALGLISSSDRSFHFHSDPVSGRQRLFPANKVFFWMLPEKGREPGSFFPTFKPLLFITDWSPTKPFSLKPNLRFGIFGKSCPNLVPVSLAWSKQIFSQTKPESCSSPWSGWR